MICKCSVQNKAKKNENWLCRWIFFLIFTIISGQFEQAAYISVMRANFNLYKWGSVQNVLGTFISTMCSQIIDGYIKGQCLRHTER